MKRLILIFVLETFFQSCSRPTIFSVLKRLEKTYDPLYLTDTIELIVFKSINVFEKKNHHDFLGLPSFWNQKEQNYLLNFLDKELLKNTERNNCQCHKFYWNLHSFYIFIRFQIGLLRRKNIGKQDFLLQFVTFLWEKLWYG